MGSSTYAIKTGTVFTSVTVNTDANQCTVARADGEGRIYYEGVGESSIRSAAQDGAGASYRTLRGLMTDYPHATRRADLDC